MTHLGLHGRGYLPHWDYERSVQAITFRLADSLPRKVVQVWRDELKADLENPTPTISQKAAKELHQRITRFEDAGHGDCILRLPQCAQLLQEMLISKHGGSYKLIAWCIMPNHVHVLMRLLDETPLGVIVKQWKAVSAVEINRHLQRKGSVWMPDYHDRYIRDFDHYYNAISYIGNNPVKAGLCIKPDDWKFSSAGQGWTPE